MDVLEPSAAQEAGERLLVGVLKIGGLTGMSGGGAAPASASASTSTPTKRAPSSSGARKQVLSALDFRDPRRSHAAAQVGRLSGPG